MLSFFKLKNNWKDTSQWPSQKSLLHCCKQGILFYEPILFCINVWKFIFLSKWGLHTWSQLFFLLLTIDWCVVWSFITLRWFVCLFLLGFLSLRQYFSHCMTPDNIKMRWKLHNYWAQRSISIKSLLLWGGAKCFTYTLFFINMRTCYSVFISKWGLDSNFNFS